MNNIPFNKGNLSYAFQKIKEEIVERVAKIDDIGESDIDRIKADLLTSNSLSTFDLHREGISIEHTEINRDRPGSNAIQTTFFVPITGDINLLQYNPSTYRLSKNYMSIHNGGIICTYTSSSDYPETIQSMFEKDLEDLQFNIEGLNKDISAFNSHLADFIYSQLKVRVAQVGKNKQFVESFKYPLKSDLTAKRLYEVPVRRKQFDISKLSSDKPKNQEYFLSEGGYDSIIDTIHNMTLVFERSPNAFQDMEEETLRFLLLVPLNGLFPGAATGETFNYEGKTDILIRHKDKNIFIAECKFWVGEKGLLDAIDQILGYLSWRDTKTAIILFNKNKNLTSVLSQIPVIVQKHSCFDRQLAWSKYETASRYQFHHRGDGNRKLLLSILVFDVPQHD